MRPSNVTDIEASQQKAARRKTLRALSRRRRAPQASGIEYFPWQRRSAPLPSGAGCVSSNLAELVFPWSAYNPLLSLTLSGSLAFD
jgi:hypothetical protein